VPTSAPQTDGIVRLREYPWRALPIADGPGLLRGKDWLDAAALVHRECRILQGTEDSRDRIADLAGDEAVQQRHLPPGSGAGKDAPAGQEGEVAHVAGKAGGVACLVIRFRRRQGGGDPSSVAAMSGSASVR